MTSNSDFIDFFRQAAPYINQHRNKTFIFCIQDDEHTDITLKSLIHDIAILQSLAVRIVVVFGVRHSLNKQLTNQTFHNNLRITNADSMFKIQEVVGSLCIKIESILSMGLANSPMQGASIRTSSGNFVIAKPIGVKDGVDFGLTGEVRKIRAAEINNHLENNNIVIIPPLGYSSTGQVFNLNTEELASEVASSLKADKLLFFNNDIQKILLEKTCEKAITPKEAGVLLKKKELPDTLKKLFHLSHRACEAGINRIHIVPKKINGAVLAELFSLDGVGLLITNEAYDRIEQAGISDIPSLLQLIRPLEKKGILVRRSRERIEIEIKHFSLLKRDNSVIGCAALYPYHKEKMAELGCLSVDQEYQGKGLAETLLKHIEQKARLDNIEHLFCLTTQASHWFIERGFHNANLSDLPKRKKDFYNYARKSKLLIKKI